MLPTTIDSFTQVNYMEAQLGRLRKEEYGLLSRIDSIEDTMSTTVSLIAEFALCKLKIIEDLLSLPTECRDYRIAEEALKIELDKVKKENLSCFKTLLEGHSTYIEAEKKIDLTTQKREELLFLFSSLIESKIEEEKLEIDPRIDLEQLKKTIEDKLQIQLSSNEQLLESKKQIVLALHNTQSAQSAVKTQPAWGKVVAVALCFFLIAGLFMFGFVPFFPAGNSTVSHETSNGGTCIGDQCSIQPILDNSISHSSTGFLVDILPDQKNNEAKSRKIEKLNLSQGEMSLKMSFGTTKWNKYFGDVGIVPPLPRNIEAILDSPCPFWSDKKVGDTHLLILVPETINGKPLTLNSLQRLIQNPKEGHKMAYNRYADYVKNDLGNQSHPSHWVLMTRDVIPNSRGIIYQEQKNLLANYAQKSGQPYELPKALEAMVCILMEHVQTGTMLYGKKPVTYTSCQEMVSDDQWPVAIGRLATDGLVITLYWNDSHISNGIGACRKFL